MRYIVLDTETTGLKVEAGHRLIEVGCLEIVDRFFSGRKYHQKINPKRDIDESAQKVHGITLPDLKNCPEFSEIADSFCEFIKGSVLIIHNALVIWLRKNGGQLIDCQQETSHLSRMGGRTISALNFKRISKKLMDLQVLPWKRKPLNEKLFTLD
tara:strand:- start:482 stop:946 length:465 start_codon:yes stop_codon:yes gene_type:complete